MKKLIMSSVFVVIMAGTLAPAAPGDINIIEVRRNIPLSDTEPIYKDFYLNVGEDAGFKKNQVLTVVRKVDVKDASGSQTVGDLKIPVGQIKVIAIYPKLTVAREYKLFPRDDLPMLEQTGLMVGDTIDLKNPMPDQGPSKEKTAAKKNDKTADLSTTTGPI